MQDHPAQAEHVLGIADVVSGEGAPRRRHEIGGDVLAAMRGRQDDPRRDDAAAAQREALAPKIGAEGHHRGVVRFLDAVDDLPVGGRGDGGMREGDGQQDHGVLESVDGPAYPARHAADPASLDRGLRGTEDHVLTDTMGGSRSSDGSAFNARGGVRREPRSRPGRRVADRTGPVKAARLSDSCHRLW